MNIYISSPDIPEMVYTMMENKVPIKIEIEIREKNTDTLILKKHLLFKSYPFKNFIELNDSDEKTTIKRIPIEEIWALGKKNTIKISFPIVYFIKDKLIAIKIRIYMLSLFGPLRWITKMLKLYEFSVEYEGKIPTKS